MSFKKVWKFLITDQARKNKSPARKTRQKRHLDNHHNRKSTSLKKLTSPVILFILINSILGNSLFYLPSLGVIAAGSASLVAWALIFIVAVLVMLYIGELITLHPTSGGTYEFCKRSYGRFGSFLAGWMIWVAGNFGMALGLIAAAQYFIPGADSRTFIIQIIFVIIWALALNFMAYRGVDAGVTMLVVFGAIAVFVVSAMILPSFISIPKLFGGTIASPFSFELLRPFFRASGVGILSHLGLSLLLISEAFFGFEAVSYLANEAKEPKKLHKVLIKAVVICGAIMTLYIFSSLGTVAYSDYITDSRPFALQALNTMGDIGQGVVVFGMYLVIIGSVAAWPITGSRLIRAMAADTLFPRHFAVLHRKHKSPHRAIYFQTLATLIFSWILFRGYIVGWEDPYRTVYLIYVLISIAVLSMILLCVPILRRREARLTRPFRAPLATIGPIALVTFFVILLTNWIFIERGVAFSIIGLALSFIALGVPFYFLVEMFYDRRAILKVNELLAYLAVLGEKLFFPLTVRSKILQSLGNIQGKTILEYGCSVGTLTQKLALLVSKTGKIIATDISLNKVKIADKRTKKIKHVQVHHHPHLHDFKLTLPVKYDHIVSVGMLSYMLKPQQILKSLSKSTKRGSRVMFLDYDKFFHLIPNVSWIENDHKVKQMFRKAGFDVTIERKRSLFWQYIIISGHKQLKKLNKIKKKRNKNRS